MTKPQSPLTALERPHCPRCQVRMPLIGAERDLDGSDNRTFQCERCGESLSMKAADPMKSGSAGWLDGELKPPT